MAEHYALRTLREAIGDTEHIAIFPHNDPDPDAIASAAGLQLLLARHYNAHAPIWYNGIIGRAENRALVDYLGCELNLIDGPLPPYSAILVDTQPGAGNNPLSPETPVLAVFDHHPLRPETARAAFADVRPHIGSCATMITRYLQAAGLKPGTPLATALFYGIKSDTLALGRNVDELDIDMYIYLQALIDTKALIDIEQAQVPPAYFRSFNTALRAARVYNDLLVADVGLIAYPDLVAELADWLLRLEGIHWVVCLGIYHNTLRLAVRTRDQGGAGQVAQAIVGQEGIAGGHGNMAGGQINLDGRNAGRLARQLQRRTLSYFKANPLEGRRLVKLH